MVTILRDDFNDNAIDLSIWSIYKEQGSVLEEQDLLKCTAPSADTMDGVYTKNKINLEGKTILIKLTHQYEGTPQFTYVLLHHETFQHRWLNTIRIRYGNSNGSAPYDLIVDYDKEGTVTEVKSQTGYSSSKDLWIRITMSNNVIKIEVSTDGETFTEFASFTNPFGTPYFYIGLYIRTNVNYPGTSAYDFIEISAAQAPYFKIVSYDQKVTVEIGKQIGINVEVQNNGDVDGDVEIRLVDPNGNIVDSKTLTISAGARAKTTLTLTSPSTIGTYTYKIEAYNPSLDQVDDSVEVTVEVTSMLLTQLMQLMNTMIMLMIVFMIISAIMTVFK